MSFPEDGGTSGGPTWLPEIPKELQPNRASILALESGKCIELYAVSGKHEGKLLGYAIFFAGSWDGWMVQLGRGRRRMTHVAHVGSSDEAIDTILAQHGFTRT